MRNKRVISLCVSLIITASVFTTANAEETKTSQTRIQKGLQVENSVPEEAIKTLSEGMIEELQKEEGTVVSVTTEYVDLETDLKTESVKPTSDFKLTIAATRIKTLDTEGTDTFKFVACGKWLNNPVYKFTDCMGISWSDSFTLRKNYAYTREAGAAGVFNTSNLYLYDIIPEAGLAYDVDLNPDASQQEEIYIIATVYKDDDEGSANAVASYGHIKLHQGLIIAGINPEGKPISMNTDRPKFYPVQKATPAYVTFDY